MNYKIVKEKAEDTVYWALMEYREGYNEPWTCIADDKDRKRLERYKRKLERASA